MPTPSTSRPPRDSQRELQRLRREVSAARDATGELAPLRRQLRAVDLERRYRFIAAAQEHAPLALLCRTLGVARAGYYAWTQRDVSARAQADAVLLAQIQRIHGDSGGTFGAPRVRAALAAAGHSVSGKRVARLMRASGLRGSTRSVLAP